MPMKKLMTKAKKILAGPDTIRRHEGRTYMVVEYEVGLVDLGGTHRYVIGLDPSEKDMESKNARFDSCLKIKAYWSVDDKGVIHIKGYRTHSPSIQTGRRGP